MINIVSNRLLHRGCCLTSTWKLIESVLVVQQYDPQCLGTWRKVSLRLREGIQLVTRPAARALSVAADALVSS